MDFAKYEIQGKEFCGFFLFYVSESLVHRFIDTSIHRYIDTSKHGVTVLLEKYALYTVTRKPVAHLSWPVLDFLKGTREVK